MNPVIEDLEKSPVWVNLPAWVQTVPRFDVFCPKIPIPRRFDGQIGQYFLGSQEQGKSLRVQPLAYRWNKSTRWGYNEQEWLDLAFVDDRRIVGQVAFKKDSGVNIADYLAQIEAKGLELPHVWLLLGSEERQVRVADDAGEYLDHYHVAIVADCGIVEQQQYLGAKAFCDTDSFDWALVGEVS